jgi:hypothetical protein
LIEGPRPWLVLARNAIPVIGVYGLGWSAAAVIFQIWFDGVAALGAMLALHLRAFALTDAKAFRAPAGLPPYVMPGMLAVVWLLLLLLLGLPYWFILLFFGSAVFGEGASGSLLESPGLVVALQFALVSNVIEESRPGYERMSVTEIRLEFHWDFSMHLARVAALMLVTFFVRLGLVAAPALALQLRGNLPAAHPAPVGR